MTAHRIAGAPITWGVCEVPGWGLQLEPERVLKELRGIGLSATELGPDGFLPADPAALRTLLDGHGLELIAGFVPAVLHRADGLADQLSEVRRQATLLAEAGAGVLVLAAAAESDGYEESADLSDDDWAVLVDGIAEVEGIAAALGLETVLHPHYGTVIETAEDVDRLLARSEVGICVDTGHLLVGGADPVAVTRAAGPRVRHVHLKDVDARLAARVRDGDLGYHAAVAAGMYQVLGEGDVDIAAIVRLLEADGFDGWYVLEQDTVLPESAVAPHDPAAAAALSLDYLNGLLERIDTEART